jgi:hypothetical protein
VRVKLDLITQNEVLEVAIETLVKPIEFLKAEIGGKKCRSSFHARATGLALGYGWSPGCKVSPRLRRGGEDFVNRIVNPCMQDLRCKNRGKDLDGSDARSSACGPSERAKRTQSSSTHVPPHHA